MSEHSIMQTRIVPTDGLSHVAGLQDRPLWHMTIPQLLAKTADRFGNRDAAIFAAAGIRWTYADLARITDELALGLLALGLQKGDRIGIWSPNRSEWIAVQYASARIGAILVNINPAYRLSELEFVLNKVGCKALMLAPQFKSSDYVAMIRELAPELDDCPAGALRAARLPVLESVVQLGHEAVPGMFSFDQVMAKGQSVSPLRLEEIDQTLDPDDPINIQFTSGTTGAPKGATLTHANIVNNGRFTCETMNFTERDRLCIPVPLYHCFGMVMGSLGCVATGAAMIFPDEAFEPLSVLRAVEAERCTALYSVPTMYLAMLEHTEFKSFDLSSLRTGVMAGAPCPIEVMRRVIGEMNMGEVTICYGMTETSPVSFQSGVDDPIERRVGTVGRIHPHVEVKVVDENGRITPTGQAGELCTRGYSVMLGYWDEEEKTADSIDDEGWMHTGDLAVVDDEGYCNIVGRLKDMVIRGGENIYPREIEEFLFQHPKILVAQVFGIPDQKYGEELCAWIILKEGQSASEEEIRAYCQGQIAHYKIPRHIRFVADMPMTVTGKPQKFMMRDMMMKELGLDHIATA